jgi:AcrR family transcriptional regulator
MDNKKVREPKQQRSIEKRRKIIEAGFQLFCEKGYPNTNTAEIAKCAGVSTGIVYNYFEDKKDIFIAAFNYYAESISTPMLEQLSSLEMPLDLPKLIRQIIEMFKSSHNITKSAHEEMQAMAHTDEVVGEFFCQYQANLAKTFVELLSTYGINPTNAYEKIHISINIVEYLCHEIVYHKHEYMNYDILTDEAVKIIVDMLSS